MCLSVYITIYMFFLQNVFAVVDLYGQVRCVSTVSTVCTDISSTSNQLSNVINVPQCNRSNSMLSNEVCINAIYVVCIHVMYISM